MKMNGSVSKKRKTKDLKSDLEPQLKLYKSSKNSANIEKKQLTDENLNNEEKNSEIIVPKPNAELFCFACAGSENKLLKCSLNSCSKYYHSKCLEKLPHYKNDQSLCSHHMCSVCFLKNSKSTLCNKGELIKCNKCPRAFHAKDDCRIAGAVLISDDQMCCPDHYFPEKYRGYNAIVNLPFCVKCGCNEDLVFCKTCPESTHIKCSKIECENNTYTCARCSIAMYAVSYNEIVWAKVYDYRWWPAKILNSSSLPTKVKKMTHFEGEFPVKFYGSEDIYWTQTQRVYPFFYKAFNREDDLPNKHNFKKTMPDPTFERAIQLALEDVSRQKKIQEIELSSSKLPSYKHIKSNRPIGGVQIFTSHDISDHSICGCKSEDPDPCGYDSLCLNRNMCTECEPDVCEAGELCQNQKFQKLEYALVKPYQTKNRGWGLQCLEDIKKGHFVIEYCGDLIDEEECQRRIKHKQETGDTNFYFCALDLNRIIDAGPKGNYSRFLNHSCEPNCETQKWIVNGDPRVGLFAIKDISANSELTFDYQMDFSHFEKLKCNCGSKKCSGLIGKKVQNGSTNGSDKSSDEKIETKPVLEELTKKNGKAKKSFKIAVKK